MINHEYLNKKRVFLLPCPFADDTYTIVSLADGSRKGSIRKKDNKWIAFIVKKEIGTAETMEKAIDLLL